MKLVKSRISYSDTITDDSGKMLGVVYYGNNADAQVFRRWFEQIIDLEKAIEGLRAMIESRKGVKPEVKFEMEERRSVTVDSEPVDGGD